MAGWVTLPTQCWKGKVSETLIVYSEISDAACGYAFELGKDYLIFARLEQKGAEAWHAQAGWPKGTRFPAATTHICSGTQPIRSAILSDLDFGEPIWVRGDPDAGQPQNVR